MIIGQFGQGSEEKMKGTPLVDVRVQLYGLEQGQSELQIRISPNGAFRDAHGDGPARAKAYDRILEVVQRELRDSLAVLRDHQ